MCHTVLLSCVLNFAPAGCPHAASPRVASSDAVEEIKKAVTKRICEAHFWCNGPEWPLGDRPVALRVWVDGSKFLAEVRAEWPLFGAKVDYFWGCLTIGGEALILDNAGAPQAFGASGFPEIVAEVMKDQAQLLKAAPQYIGTLAPGDCRNPFAESPTVKAKILNQLTEVIRHELKVLAEIEASTPTRDYEIVSIGDFSVSSKSVWVLLELRQELWEIKFLRPDQCGNVDLLPRDFVVVGTWPMVRTSEEAVDSPADPRLIDQVRSHSVTIMIPIR